MSAKKRVLFVKKSGRVSGGHIKFHDYFTHTLHHPDLEPYVYLAFAKEYGPGEVWRTDLEKVVTGPDIEPFDAVFIDGRDWELLPGSLGSKTVIHLIQDFRHGDTDDRRFAYLSRAALRICISPELADAVRPHANGPLAVIPNGIDARLFGPGEKEPGSVVVWARKDGDAGKAIEHALKSTDVNARLLTRPIGRAEFARLLAQAEVFVGLTKEREGFFLPALEAMASGCAVVCADAIGNRSFCIDEETCRIARYGDAADHAALVNQLLSDDAQRNHLQESALSVAKTYSLEREQALFHRFVEDQLLAESRSVV